MSKADNSADVVITGLGPVTSIGVGAEELWESLLAARTNVVRRALPVDLGRTVEVPIAAMPPIADVPGLGPHAEFLAGQDCACYRDLAYALLASELALADAGLVHDRDDNDVGMVQAFEAPGVEHTVSKLFGMMSGPPPTDGPPPVYDVLAPSFYNMQPFLYVHVASKALGLHGFSTSVHNACSSGAFAIDIAAQQIRSGRCSVMLVMGGESFDTAVRLEWFRKLGLYAEGGESRPFYPDPRGFFVGEGAGAIVLESSAHACRRNAKVYAAYLGGAFAQQSWKQVIPDVRTGRLGRVIVKALSVSGVAREEIDLVVPHGAATQLSDGYEASCLAQALGEGAGGAAATAFKPAVGHTLAASAVIETICALLAMKHGIVPAMPRPPDDTQTPTVPIVTKTAARTIQTVLKLSTGFTGHDAALLLGRVRGDTR